MRPCALDSEDGYLGVADLELSPPDVLLRVQFRTLGWRRDKRDVVWSRQLGRHIPARLTEKPDVDFTWGDVGRISAGFRLVATVSWHYCPGILPTLISMLE